MISSMKKLGLGCTLLALLAAPAIAQTDTTQPSTSARAMRPMRGPTPLKNILATMNLNDEQKQKIQEITEWANQEQTEIRKGTGHTSETAAKLSLDEQRKLSSKIRPQMEKLNKEIREKVDAILTDDQRKELEEKLRKQSYVGGVLGAKPTTATQTN